MSDVNHVLISGRLGQDPILRQTKSDKAVTQLSVATTYGTGDKELTTWHRVSAWGKTAETCNRYLKKGSKVLVQGRIRHSKYEASDGTKRDSTEIVADQVSFLGSPRRTIGEETTNTSVSD